MTDKVVQTVLKESEYEEFKRASEKSKKSIRQAAREAIERWTQETSGISPEDPIFKLKPASYKSRKASEEHDMILYGGRKRKN
ncbi:MAG TPA: hypothetical protein VJN71_11380 [Nitrososphaerales archaeon]|nr:hypothetical protein [Nitrososphaerales archaeon]